MWDALKGSELVELLVAPLYLRLIDIQRWQAATVRDTEMTAIDFLE